MNSETIRIWDPASGDCLQTLLGHNNEVSCLTYSHDGKRIVSCSLDEHINIWDSNSGIPVQTTTGTICKHRACLILDDKTVV